MVHIVNIHEAKTQLSKLIEEVERGEEVTIARAGVPCVKLVLVTEKKREFDFLKDELPHIPDSVFFDPMSAEELAEWEDNKIYAEPSEPSHAPAARDRTSLKGRYFAPDSAFFDPLPEEELAAWEGGPSIDETP